MSLIGILVTCLVTVMKYIGKATYTHSYRKKRFILDQGVMCVLYIITLKETMYTDNKSEILFQTIKPVLLGHLDLENAFRHLKI